MNKTWVIAGLLLTAAVLVLNLKTKTVSKFVREPSIAIQDHEIRKAKTSFFRQTATYQLVSTGEILDIDYVFSCIKIEHNSKYDYGVITPVDDSGSKPGHYTITQWFPETVFRTFSSGETLQLKTFPVCDEQDLSNIQGNPHPFTIYHDKTNPLGKGWAYATHHAYDRTESDIKFLGGSLLPANKSEFKSWLNSRKKLGKEISLTQFGTFKREAGKKWSLDYNYSLQNAAAKPKNCHGVTVHEVPKSLHPRLKSLQPDSQPRYWFAYNKVTPYNELRDLKDDVTANHSKKDDQGKRYYEKNMFHPYEGTPSEDGTNTIILNNRKTPYKAGPPKPVYPKVIHQAGHSELLIDDSYKGLRYCDKSQGHYGEKILVNGADVFGENGYGPIFDVEGYLIE